MVTVGVPAACACLGAAARSCYTAAAGGAHGLPLCAGGSVCALLLWRRRLVVVVLLLLALRGCPPSNTSKARQQGLRLRGVCQSKVQDIQLLTL
jgi:hypothetical protein